MKKLASILLIVLSITLLLTPLAEAKVRVGGYYKKSGTYVKSYYRTSPDSRKSNNWSSYGNYNPYTGKKGYKK